MQSVGAVLARMGPSPAAYVRQFDPRTDAAAFATFVHRWTRGVDVVALLWVLRQMLDRSGSIEGFFAEGDDPSTADISAGLESFTTRALALDLQRAYGRVPARPGVAYFFTRPSQGSACKRLNLFLRWMVRRDAVDLGVWTRVDAARLDRPARHPRHPAWPLPAADDLHERRLANGRRHHAHASTARPWRSHPVRLLALPRRDDGQLRVWREAGEWAVPAQGSVQTDTRRILTAAKVIRDRRSVHGTASQVAEPPVVAPGLQVCEPSAREVQQHDGR